MENKVFKSKFLPDIVYEILDERWLDNDTYVIIFNDMTDKDNDVFHLEVEYHKDENKITYTRVYEHENVEAELFVAPVFKNQIVEYILRQVGSLRKDNILVKRTINVELTLDMPKSMTFGEFKQWLSDLTIKVESPQMEKVRLLDVKTIK